MLDVSVSHAYKVIREANKELSAKGFYGRAVSYLQEILRIGVEQKRLWGA